jgi:hypothetical protein
MLKIPKQEYTTEFRTLAARRLCQAGGRRQPVKIKSSYPNQVTFPAAPVTVQSCHVAKRSLSAAR